MPFIRTALLLLALATGLPARAAAQSLNALAAEALQRAARGDVEGHLRLMRRVADLAPDHPWVLYHLARAQALAGERDLALETLARAGDMGIGVDLATDTAFFGLRGQPSFAELLSRIRVRASPLVASDTAFLIRVDGLVPENVAHDPHAKGFFIGDALGRRVLHRAPDGAVREFAGPGVVRGAVLGMKPDSARGLLWVTAWADSARMSEAERRSAPRSALLAFDLTSGALRHRYVPADSLVRHLFNDLVVTRDGRIFMTDSEAGRVYRLASLGDSLGVWLQPAEGFTYPNGIALAPGERTLYVAHTEGVSAIDIETRRQRRLQPPVGSALVGVDGLYAVGDLLVGIQNAGMRLDRVIAFRVAADGRVTEARDLERRHPAYETPTTGAVVGDTLYYIANAQLALIPSSTAQEPPRRPAPIVVLKLAIPRSLSKPEPGRR